MASSRIDLNSFTWKAVKYKAEQELSEAATLLEQRRLDERDADFTRGRMNALRDILDLGNRDSEHVSE